METVCNSDLLESISIQSLNTAIQTRSHVTRFRSFLISHNLYEGFENLPPHLLNDFLRLFYENIRTETGDFYSASSLICIRAALHRYLNSPPLNKEIDIIHGPEFRGANAALKRMIEKHAEFTQLSQKSARFLKISEADMARLRAYFTRRTPELLQLEVMFHCMFYFGLTGRENMRLLTRDTLTFAQDMNGALYVHLVESRLPETMRIILSPKSMSHLRDARMFATPEEPSSCPVRALRLYLAELPTVTKENTLFPKVSAEGFSSTAILSQCTFTGLMQFLSKEANLSQVYTNYCIRVTTTVGLKDIGKGQKSALPIEETSSTASSSIKRSHSNLSGEGDGSGSQARLEKRMRSQMMLLGGGDCETQDELLDADDESGPFHGDLEAFEKATMQPLHMHGSSEISSVTSDLELEEETSMEKRTPGKGNNPLDQFSQSTHFGKSIVNNTFVVKDEPLFVDDEVMTLEESQTASTEVPEKAPTVSAMQPAASTSAETANNNQSSSSAVSHVIEVQQDSLKTVNEHFDVETSTNKSAKFILNGTFTNCTFHFH